MNFIKTSKLALQIERTETKLNCVQLPTTKQQTEEKPNWTLNVVVQGFHFSTATQIKLNFELGDSRNSFSATTKAYINPVTLGHLKKTKPHLPPSATIYGLMAIATRIIKHYQHRQHGHSQMTILSSPVT